MKTRILHTRFWKDSFVSTLSQKEKLLWVYLLTNEQVNTIGIYELPDKYILPDLDITQKELNIAKEKLKGRIVFYKGWIKLINHDKYNNFTGSAEKAKEKERGEVPQELLDDSYKKEGKEPSTDPTDTPRVNPRVYPLNSDINNPNTNHNPNKGGVGGKFSTIDSLLPEHLQLIAEDYRVQLSFVLSRLDDMRNWCAAKGKSYKDYNAALRNWVKRDAFSIIQQEKSKPRKAVRVYDENNDENKEMVRSDDRGQGDNSKPGGIQEPGESGLARIKPGMV